MGRLIALLLLFSLAACSGLPVLNTHSEFERIKVGPGPEDMVLDRSTGKARLLVSCDNRRKGQPEQAEIWMVDPQSGNALIMTRIGEPEGLVFHPHGIALKHSMDKTYLFVVNHNDADKVHSFLVYQVLADELRFISAHTSEWLRSPNDIHVLEDETVLLTNDTRKRMGIWEMLLNMKSGSIAAYDPEGQDMELIAKKLRYPNGLASAGDTVYVATSRHNALFRYVKDENGQLGDRVRITKLMGLDNIQRHGDELLIAAHPKLMAFYKHSKDPANLSPGIVYSVNRHSGESKVLYSNDGSQISGPSTAIRIGDDLYICQVFEPFLLKVRLKE